MTETGETPPWQRAARKPAAPKPDPRPTARIPAQSAAGSGPTTAAHAAGSSPAPRDPMPAPVSAPSGPTPAVAAASPAGGVSAPAEADAGRAKEYASELPDLSGPRPAVRPSTPERKPATDSGPNSGPSEAPAGRSGARVQVGTRSRTAGPVRASMQIRRIDPWSTLKVSLLLSVAIFFVWMIAVAILYLVLGAMGVWTKLNSNVGDLLSSAGGAGELVSAGSIFSTALLIGLVNIVLMTAMATIGAFIYNLSTDIVGGIEVTLADRD
ncbi:DUF3566 domain-containing protein [Mycolicibacterium brumae]|nr:DUF3566 domain-containing protein [Mycolicibacterium brumae]UWW07023.1 DUF3566 domain-containing protein [Mycolicibacterium brumae]